MLFCQKSNYHVILSESNYHVTLSSNYQVTLSEVWWSCCNPITFLHCWKFNMLHCWKSNNHVALLEITISDQGNPMLMLLCWKFNDNVVLLESKDQIALLEIQCTKLCSLLKSQWSCRTHCWKFRHNPKLLLNQGWLRLQDGAGHSWWHFRFHSCRRPKSIT